MQPLPKRAALEKTNGASALFNPSVLHYQQALASAAAQMQQPAAFYPTGKPRVTAPCSLLQAMARARARARARPC